MTRPDRTLEQLIADLPSAKRHALAVAAAELRDRFTARGDTALAEIANLIAATADHARTLEDQLLRDALAPNPDTLELPGDDTP